jgi:type VI secretion system secreted protein VgrG
VFGPGRSLSQTCNLTSALGDSVLLVRRLEGREALSQLFHFELEVYAVDGEVDFDGVIGTPAAVDLRFDNGDGRIISGVISSFTQKEVTTTAVLYGLELVPWLWLLTKQQNCRIFHEKDVEAILEDVFRANGFWDYEFKLTNPPSKREVCVQYQESDFDFVSRLLEEEGIYYYFRHEEKRHVLVLADHHQAEICTPGGVITYHEEPHNRPEWLHSFDVKQLLHPGRYATSSFTFQDPADDLEVQAKGIDDRSDDSKAFAWSGGRFDGLEVFDWSGRFETISEGEGRARVRMEAIEAHAVEIQGVSGLLTLCPGFVFDLERHYRKAFNVQYLLTSVEHAVEQEIEVETGHPAPSCVYKNRFTCIPANVPYRPLLRTPMPRINSSQTALVVGPPGEEIWADEFGRVKLRFHWDRWGRGEDAAGNAWDTSCWVRVAHQSAGKRWGSFSLPRVGQEVIVEFLEGDPDRPIVTGVLYNGRARPPYDPRKKATISGVKTSSSKGGGGSNELRFEDKKDEEQIYIHAQKNYDRRVENDAFIQTEHDAHEIISNDHLRQVKNESHETVDQDRFRKVGKDEHVEVVGKLAEKVGESYSLTVTGDVIEVFKADHSSKVTGNIYLKGSGIVIESSSALTLKAGPSSVVINSTGVSLTGPTVKIAGKFELGPGSPPMMGMAGSVVAPTAPKLPEEADVADPGRIDDLKREQKTAKTGKYGAATVVPFKPEPLASGAAAPGEETERTWIEIELVDEADEPVPGEPYEITLPDGRVARGTLGPDGKARIDGIDPGSCQVTFPNLDREAWENA